MASSFLLAVAVLVLQRQGRRRLLAGHPRGHRRAHDRRLAGGDVADRADRSRDAARASIALVRPAGPGWADVRAACGDLAPLDDLRAGFVGTVAGCVVRLQRAVRRRALADGPHDRGRISAVTFVGAAVVDDSCDRTAMAVSGPPVTSVVLARGLGRRMQEADAAVSLDARPAPAPPRPGGKAMMPVGEGDGRPVSRLRAERAGRRRVHRGQSWSCAPDHECLRERYAARRRVPRSPCASRCSPSATGTAHAVLAAEPVVGGRPFLVLNADNLYPAEVAARARGSSTGRACPRSSAPRLVEESGFPDGARRRSSRCSTSTIDGWLTGIREKPDAADLAASVADAPISMNLWRFDARIFQACRDVPPFGARRVRTARGGGAGGGARRPLPRDARARRRARSVARSPTSRSVSAQLAGREPRL